MPIDFLALKTRVANPAEATQALRQLEFICLQIDSLHAQDTLLFPAFIKSALIQHVFTHLVPVPVPPESKAHSNNAWSFGPDLLWAQQLEIVLTLQRICEHYAGAVFSILPSKAFDAHKLVVFAAMAAIADHALRQRASDHFSIVSQVLRGEEIDPNSESSESYVAPFGLSADIFYRQSESLEIVEPELNVTRAAVLDYFHELQSKDNLLFPWEQDNWMCVPNQATSDFADRVARLHYRVVQGGPIQFLAGNPPIDFLAHNFEEYRAYRDVVFWWKYVEPSSAPLWLHPAHPPLDCSPGTSCARTSASSRRQMSRRPSTPASAAGCSGSSRRYATSTAAWIATSARALRSRPSARAT